MFDTAQAASIMSSAIGKPVRVQFMRWDEQGWTHYAPASLVDVRGGVDASGNIVAYDWTQWTQGGTSIYTSRELLGSGPGSAADRRTRSRRRSPAVVPTPRTPRRG